MECPKCKTMWLLDGKCRQCEDLDALKRLGRMFTIGAVLQHKKESRLAHKEAHEAYLKGENK